MSFPEASIFQLDFFVDQNVLSDSRCRYGFLSENIEFATAIQDAGIQFLGPDPATFEMFSLKHTARAIAEEAKVPA